MARSLEGSCPQGYSYNSTTQRCEPNPVFGNDLPTNTPTPTPTEALTSLQAGQLGQIPGIGANVTTIAGQTGQIPGLVSTVGNIAGQTGQIPGLVSDVGTIARQTGQIGNIATGVTGLGSDVANLRGRLGLDYTVPANQDLASYLAGQIGSGANAARGAVAGAQTALEKLLREQAGQTRTDILGRLGTFDGGDLATRLNAGFTGITGGGTDTLKSLGQNIGDVGTNMTASIGTLTGGQADITEALLGPTGSGGGISGAVSDLATSTGDYQTAATQARQDLQKAVLGGQENITGMLDRGDVRSQLNQLAQDVGTLRQGPQQDYASVAQLLAANAPAQTNTDVLQRAQFVQLMDSLRGLVNNPQSGLDPTVRATYASLTNAFGPNGQFMAQTTNPSTGEITRRQVTADGQLRAQNFNQMGQATTNPISLNINELMTRAAPTVEAPKFSGVQKFAMPGLMGQQGPSLNV